VLVLNFSWAVGGLRPSFLFFPSFLNTFPVVEENRKEIRTNPITIQKVEQTRNLLVAVEFEELVSSSLNAFEISPSQRGGLRMNEYLEKGEAEPAWLSIIYWVRTH